MDASLFALAVAAAAALFAQPVVRLARIWVGDGTYLYGPIVIALALVHARRHPGGGSASGGPDAVDVAAGPALILMSMLLRLLGHYGSVTLLDDAALYLLLVGALVALRGRRWAWAYRLPLASVILVFPFWEILTDGMHAPFRATSAFLAAALLRLAGIPLLVEGYTIHLPHDSMFVDKACSGLNNLFAIVSVGVLAALLFLRRPWNRVGFVVLSVALAVLANGVRIALIGLNLHHDFSPISHGPFHVLQGLVVTGIAFTFMLGLLLLLERRERADGAGPRREGGAAPTRARAAGTTARSAALALSAGVLLLAAGAALWRVPAAVPRDTPLAAVPWRIGAWQGAASDHAASIAYRALSPSDHIARTYANGWGEVDLFVGYWQAQRQGAEFVHHRVRGIENASNLRLDGRRGGTGGERLAFRDREPGRRSDGAQALWYDVDGRLTSSRTVAKLLCAWNGLASRRTNGAVVVASLRAGGALRPEQVEDFVLFLNAVRDELRAPAVRR